MFHVSTRYSTLTFDIEEWFQVENLKSVMPPEKWCSQPTSVVKNTYKILNILDNAQVHGTFFILGYVAKQFPNLVREILRLGHEVASHGSNHDLTYRLDDEKLRMDILDSKNLLEDIIGVSVKGYRAPNFSINDRLINILRQIGFTFDSSFNPFQLNNRYGTINMDYEKMGGILKFPGNLYEIPMSTVEIFGYRMPMAGGAYFRLLPLPIFKRLIKMNFQKTDLYNFYLHPWEFEPEQPRMRNIKYNYQLRHYTGLKHTENKFENLIHYLKDLECKFLTMSQYLDSL